MTSPGPFLCYRELVPPTCTDLSAFFQVQTTRGCIAGEGSSLYLITCTSSTINIYNVLATDCEERSNKLSLLLSTKVFGRPQDLAIHRHRESNERDNIVLSFDCGKFVIVSYNTITNSLDLLRTFNAEDQAIGLGSDVRASYHCRSQTIGIGALPILSIDNSRSIACSVLYGSQIFVMPLPNCVDQLFTLPQLQGKLNGSPRAANTTFEVQNPLMIEFSRQREKDKDVMKKLGSSGQFVIDLMVTLKIRGPILDVCFVEGYNRPTLAVLIESGLVTPGHVKQSRHTCSLYFLGISISSKSLSIIWKQENLPHDSLRLYPLQSSHHSLSSGVILTSMNALLVITPCRENGVFAIATNGFATTSIHPDFNLQPSNLTMGLELDSSQWICPDNHNFVGVLKNGVLLQLRIHTIDHTAVATSKVNLELVLIGCGNMLASCIASHCNDAEDQHLWFVGSRQSDNILLHVKKNAITDEFNSAYFHQLKSPTGNRVGSAKVSHSNNSIKRQRRQSKGDAGEMAIASGQSTDFMETEESHFLTVAEEDSLFYTELLDMTTMATEHLYEYSVCVTDSISVIGPIRSTSIVQPDDCFDRIEAVDWIAQKEGNENRYNHGNNSSSGNIPDWESKDTVLLSAGLNENAAFYRVANGIRLSKLTTKFFNGATAVSTVSSHDNSYQLLFLSYSIPMTQTKVFYLSYSSNFDSDRLPQLSSKEMSSDLTGFLSSSATIAVGRVSQSLVVQVFAKGLRLVKIPSKSYDLEEGEPLQDLLVAESEENGGLGGTLDENIVSADILSGWVTIATTGEHVYLFQYEACDESLILRRVGKKLKEDSQNESELHQDYFERLSGDRMTSDSRARDFDRNNDTELVMSQFFSIPAAPVHVSLFEGYFPDPSRITCSQRTFKSSEPSENPKNNVQVEEQYLYGNILPNDDDLALGINGDAKSPPSEPFKNVEEEQPLDNVILLIVCDSSGFVSFYHVDSGKLYFRTALLEIMPATILVADPPSSNRNQSNILVQSPFLSRNISESMNSSNSSSDRRLIATRMEWLTPSSGAPESLQSLCLVGLMDTGVTVVYKAVWSGCRPENRMLQSFVKVSTSHLSFRKRSRHFKARRNIHALGDPSQPLAPGQSEENEDIKALKLVRSQDINGKTTIIVCGNYRPSVVYNDNGLPQLQSLGFPEVPYGNSGNCAIASLSIGDAIGGFISLWTEHGVGSAFSRGQANLALYQEVVSSSIANSLVTVKRVKSGITVHRSVELLKKTEEKTELAMLEKKMYVLSCSQDVVVPFVTNLEATSASNGLKDDVVVDDGIDALKSDTDFVYFFSNLESFCSPNAEIAPTPTTIEKQYRVAILQGSSVVDEYHLLEHERIIDIDVVYLPVEVLSVIPNSKITTKKVLRRVFIVVATASLDKHGEDSPADGRLLLFALEHTLTPIANVRQSLVEADKGEPSAKCETMEVDYNSVKNTLGKIDASKREPEEMQMKPKLSLLSTMVGPASIVRQLGDSYVLTTIGPVVYVYRLDSTTMNLEQIAFFFSKFFITTVSIVKNYISIADAMHNVQLLVWREEDWILMLVSKDYSNTTSRAVSFISDGSSMGILVGDDEGNVQLLQYDPKRELESAKGARLLCIADFHVGSEITCFSLHSTISLTALGIGLSSNSPALVAKLLPSAIIGGPAAPPPPPPKEPRPVSFTGSSSKSPRNARGSFGSQSLLAFGGRMVKTSSPRTCLIGGTMDGAVGMFVPVDERIYKRLNLLQHMMSIALESICAMNPKDYRLFKSSRFRLEKKKGILDGTILWRFVSLDATTQDYLAASMGTSVGTILENLQDIDLAMQFF